MLQSLDAGTLQNHFALAFSSDFVVFVVLDLECFWLWVYAASDLSISICICLCAYLLLVDGKPA